MFELVLSRNWTFVSQNSKPKNRVYWQPKTGFSVLKKLRVTRFFGFGKNRVGNTRRKQKEILHKVTEQNLQKPQ